MSYAKMSINDVFDDLAVQRQIAFLKANSPGKIMSGAKRNRRNLIGQVQSLVDKFAHVRNQKFKRTSVMKK